MKYFVSTEEKIRRFGYAMIVAPFVALVVYAIYYWFTQAPALMFLVTGVVVYFTVAGILSQYKQRGL